MAVEVKTMEVKKNQQLAAPANANTKETSSKARQWSGFLGDIKSEFTKISWTTPEELTLYTKIVVAGTFLFGMGIYFMDLAIQVCLGSLEYVLRLIAG